MAGYYDVVTARTRTVYDRLPEVYRDADSSRDYPLLRYLALLLDQLNVAADISARIDAQDGTSDLVSPTAANAAWLPWLAQLVGVNIGGLTTAQARAALADPRTSWDHGTPSALADAAKTGLTGTKAVTVTPHYTGNPFLIGIGTKDSETSILDTWGELEIQAPTWGHLRALGSFATARSSGPIIAGMSERPAGFTLIRYSTGA